MHISQPTISRDIDFISNLTSSSAKRKDLAHIMYHEQQNSLDGVQEVMKNLWLIIDNPKIEVKEKMKTIKLMLYSYNIGFSLIDSEPLIKDFFNREEKVKSDKEALMQREQEISRKEKALERELEDHLKNQKLPQQKIWEIRDPEDPNAVF